MYRANEPVGGEQNQNAAVDQEAAARPRAIRDHLAPMLDDLSPGIVAPEIQAAHFELKPVMFNMLNSIGQFGGSPREDARQHIRAFLESWADLCCSFLMRYNPPNMHTQLRNDIVSFRQADDESMYESWDRYKGLLRKCNNHGFQDWTQVVMFYNGVNAPTPNNDYQFPTSRLGQGRRTPGKLDLDANDSVAAQLSAITNMLKNLHKPTEVQDARAVSCVLCDGNHNPNDFPAMHESASYVGNYNINANNPYSNTYNPGGLPSDTEVTKRNGKEQCSVLTLRSGTTINKNVKFGGDENTKAFSASTQKESEVQDKAQEEEGREEVLITKPSGGQCADATAKAVPAQTAEDVRPPPPFPQRLKKLKEDTQFKKFVDMLDQLHIDVPFLEAIDQMPTYAKFLKDIITKKRTIERYETVATAKEYFSGDIPPKRNDPGSFIIPCSIGDNYVGKALCDLGSSVNLMPKSVFMKLGMGIARPTTVILQLADRSHVRPEGKVEDLLVKVGKFVFLADFLILDCEEDHKAPIILG
ncbi:hypothetical protein V6N12_045492 [Hibiscus sabdariffa]|uniref:Retrotransposon gag domain-containing protein n=1 Tax=Hibiscus sabdariffa TaxID=183260 RepID=A0ABR2G3M6_9ROSI